MSVENVMYEEAKKEFEEVGKMELGSEAYVKTVQGANSMVDRLNEAAKIENETRKLDIEERRLDIEEKKNEVEKKDKFIKNAISVGTSVLYVGVTIWANVSSKRFEQGFTHTTEAGRNSTRKLLGLLDRFK